MKPTPTPSRLIQAIVLSLALLVGSGTVIASVSTASATPLIPLVDRGGAGGSGDSIAGDPPAFAGSQNQRSILMIESKVPPGGVLAGAAVPENAQTPNQRSIVMTESKESQQGVEVAFTPGQGVNFCIECGGIV